MGNSIYNWVSVDSREKIDTMSKMHHYNIPVWGKYFWYIKSILKSSRQAMIYEVCVALVSSFLRHLYLFKVQLSDEQVHFFILSFDICIFLRYSKVMNRYILCALTQPLHHEYYATQGQFENSLPLVWIQSFLILYWL